MPPKRSFAAAYIARTESCSATFTCTARPPTSPATFSAAPRSTSATHTCAPSSVKRWAASAPMPPPAPVITQTFPSSLFIPSSRTRFHFAVAGHRLHAELAAEAALLEAAERRRDAHGRVRVDREDTGLEGTGH